MRTTFFHLPSAVRERRSRIFFSSFLCKNSVPAFEITEIRRAIENRLELFEENSSLLVLSFDAYSAFCTYLSSYSAGWNIAQDITIQATSLD